ncbi:MAG: sigma 54-interacting transcriptional regulator [Thermodesulfobacteriota bacterium]
MARKSLQAGDREAAWNSTFNALSRLSNEVESVEGDTLLVAAALGLSDLGFVMGKGFSDLTILLQQALGAAYRVGDRRSEALIKLHLGRLYYFGERRHDAIKVFHEGKELVEELGDEDILIRSAEFLGLYYFIQGFFEDAVVHFERAVQSFETFQRNAIVNPSAPIWLGYCAAYMGQFYRAIGILDYYRRLSLEKADRSLAATIRSVLGIVLAIAKKKQEAAYHLSGALQEALKTNNNLALYFSRGGLAYCHCLEGRLAEARELLMQTVTEGAAAGLIRQYASPMVLEMLYEIHRSGIAPVSQLNFQREVHRILQEPNIHLRGVALRLRAMDRRNGGEDEAQIRADLEASEKYLKRAGTPLQVAMTRIELARLRLRKGEQDEARQLAQRAWMMLSGDGEDLYPDDLRHLLRIRDETLMSDDLREEFLTRFLDVIRALVPSADLDRLLSRTVEATNRFFGAERGAIFWFSERRNSRDPILRATCNLTQRDVASDDFRPNLDLVRQAYQQNEPQVVRLERSDQWPYAGKAILCLPFQVGRHTRGVLYHDNSYLQGSFNLLDKERLVQTAQYLTIYLGQIHAYCLRVEKQASESTVQLDHGGRGEILTRDAIMKKILAQADMIAKSDSTVLILGETGVGKELLANRIHRTSARRDRSFVVVDPTTLPENLVESELFGHEKGAFTGADRQRKGRIEVAHGGTLFIDEVGEIPKSIQVKLLRALQEKTFVRIGGTQTLYSDFRLICATNRDLAREVSAGRFREDLYYRLNVVPLTIPSLRERLDDVRLLAHHFVSQYTARYGKPHLKLSTDDESRLAEYEWPGNVRELKNILERAVLLSTEDGLEIELPSRPRTISDDLFADLPTLDEMQKRYIRFVLAKTDGRIGGPRGAAAVLGMKRSSLYTRMEKLGLR